MAKLVMVTRATRFTVLGVNWKTRRSPIWWLLLTPAKSRLFHEPDRLAKYNQYVIEDNLGDVAKYKGIRSFTTLVNKFFWQDIENR